MLGSEPCLSRGWSPTTIALLSLSILLLLAALFSKDYLVTHGRSGTGTDLEYSVLHGLVFAWAMVLSVFRSQCTSRFSLTRMAKSQSIDATLVRFYVEIRVKIFFFFFFYMFCYLTETWLSHNRLRFSDSL